MGLDLFPLCACPCESLAVNKWWDLLFQSSDCQVNRALTKVFKFHFVHQGAGRFKPKKLYQFRMVQSTKYCSCLQRARWRNTSYKPRFLLSSQFNSLIKSVTLNLFMSWVTWGCWEMDETSFSQHACVTTEVVDRLTKSSLPVWHVAEYASCPQTDLRLGHYFILSQSIYLKEKTSLFYWIREFFMLSSCKKKAE